MSKEEYDFELRRGFNLEDHFTANLQADMAEEIQRKVIDLVGSEVEKVMATEKGQRMF